MTGESFFKIDACYKIENFKTGEKEPQAVVEEVKMFILDCYEKRTGYRTDFFNTSLGSVRWNGMVADVSYASMSFPNLVIVITQQIDGENCFDDDGNTFTRFAFNNGAFCKSTGKVVCNVVYGDYSSFEIVYDVHRKI